MKIRIIGIDEEDVPEEIQKLMIGLVVEVIGSDGIFWDVDLNDYITALKEQKSGQQGLESLIANLEPYVSSGIPTKFLLDNTEPA